MIVQAYDYFLIVWFVLAGLSTTYVAYDQFRNNPEPTVMRWGFVLVTLYMGPFGPWRANVTGRRCFVRAGAVFQVPFLLQRAGTLLVRGLKGAGSGVDEPCPAGHGSPSRAPGAPGLPRPGPARAPRPRPRLQRPPVTGAPPVRRGRRGCLDRALPERRTPGPGSSGLRSQPTGLLNSRKFY